MKTFGLTEDELLEFNKPLYGLCDAGDCCDVTIDEHTVNDVELTPTQGDSSLYVKRKEAKLKGLMGTYVDDCLNAEDIEYEKLIKLTLSEFDSKPRVYDSFDLFGKQLVTIERGCFRLSQKNYTTNINFVEKDSLFEEYRRYRALFSWLCHTRSDIACYANKTTQLTERAFLFEKI